MAHPGSPGHERQRLNLTVPQAALHGKRFARRSGPTCCPMFDQRQQFAYPKWLREVPVASAREYLHLVSGHGKRSNRNDRNRVCLIIIFEPTSRFHSALVADYALLAIPLGGLRIGGAGLAEFVVGLAVPAHLSTEPV